MFIYDGLMLYACGVQVGLLRASGFRRNLALTT